MNQLLVNILRLAENFFHSKNTKKTKWKEWLNDTYVNGVYYSGIENPPEYIRQNISVSFDFDKFQEEDNVYTGYTYTLNASLDKNIEIHNQQQCTITYTTSTGETHSLEPVQFHDNVLKTTFTTKLPITYIDFELNPYTTEDKIYSGHNTRLKYKNTILPKLHYQLFTVTYNHSNDSATFTCYTVDNPDNPINPSGFNNSQKIDCYALYTGRQPRFFTSYNNLTGNSLTDYFFKQNSQAEDNQYIQIRLSKYNMNSFEAYSGGVITKQLFKQ